MKCTAHVHKVSLLLVACLALSAASRSLTSHAERGLVHTRKPSEVASRPPPTAAGAYLDNLFAEPTRARAALFGNFNKRSEYAVVFMAYNRVDIIRSTFAALLRSERLEEFDLFVSQDGDSSYVLDVPVPAGINFVYVRHPHNLCPGLHHYFVRSMAFEMFGYKYLIIIEDDNRVHPQAILILASMLEQSESDPKVGLVSIADMDNSLLIDESHFNAAYQRASMDVGHLWVYGMHASRFQKVSGDLRDYYDIIKCYDYRRKHAPPLHDELLELLKSKSLSPDVPLSQDSFVLQSLLRAGYRQRLVTLLRFFEPLGYQGIHFNKHPTEFYTIFGQDMYRGQVTREPYDITKSTDELLLLERQIRERVEVLYRDFLGRSVEGPVADNTVMRLLEGRHNSVEMVLRGMITDLGFWVNLKKHVTQRGGNSRGQQLF